MSIITIISLLTFITSASMGCFVLYKTPTNKTNRIWSYLTFSVALWGFSFFMVTIVKLPSEAEFWWKIAHIGITLISFFFYQFVIRFLEIRDQSFSIITYIIAAFFLIITPTNLLVNHAYWFKDSFYYFGNPPTPLYIIYVSIWILTVGYTHFLLYLHSKKVSIQKRNQIKYIFCSMFISYAGGMTSYLPVFGVNLMPYGNITIPAYPLIITYAILKHRLLNIEVVIKKSLAYSILVSTLTLIYFVFVIGCEHLFHNLIGYKTITSPFLASIIIAISFIPLKNRIQNIIDKLIFKGTAIEISNQNDLLRQEIIRTERLKTVAILASGMAHEIKNPLTPIKTFAEELPKRLDDKEFLLKFSRIINNEVNRIDTLVQELLDYAKPTPPQLKPAGIHQLLDHTADFLNNDLIKHKITLVKDYQLPSGQLLNLDENQFRQALLNIILNAIDATQNSGALTITTTLSKRNTAEIILEDTGKGISPDDLTHIFDPFFSKKDRGTGLGLAITHEIIKNHNGKILVESQLGVGTKFIIELPITHPYETTQSGHGQA